MYMYIVRVNTCKIAEVHWEQKKTKTKTKPSLDFSLESGFNTQTSISSINILYELKFSRISWVKPSRKFPLQLMSIYSNDNISKIAKLTTRELPHLAKKSENNYAKIMAYTVWGTGTQVTIFFEQSNVMILYILFHRNDHYFVTVAHYDTTFTV